MQKLFEKTRKANQTYRKVSTDIKNNILKSIALLLESNKEELMKANEEDIRLAKLNSIKDSLIDRLRLDNKVIKNMIDSLYDLIGLEDPVGSVVEGYRRPNGLHIIKIRVPIGVIGIIYESRPNVTIDAAGLCIKAGNTTILKGGKEAVNSNRFLVEIIKRGLIENNVNEDVVNLLEDPARVYIDELLKAKGLVDLIIPRGGESLINYVVENSLIPVIKHDKGICHTYIDEFADIEKAINIAFNAKVQRPSVCNAMETLLVHKDIELNIMPPLLNLYKNAGVEIRGCKEMLKYEGVLPAKELDWSTEYLDLILSIKIVNSIEDAIYHINSYGSGHSDAIITENYTNATMFLNEVDSAAVYVNASTRFTDGKEFGMGAEIGISTQKIHCRGPMGLKDLTTTKYLIYGSGQIRM